MQIELTYQSPQGDILNLANNKEFILTDVDGLTKTESEISAANAALTDGTTITNVKANPRPIVVYCEFMPNVDVETAKRNIFFVVKPKQTGVLTYIHNGRTVTIDATIESIDMPRFNNKVVMQITFYCAFPFWQDAAFIISDIRHEIALHHFKFAVTSEKPLVFGKIGGQTTRNIQNDGDVAVGLQIYIVALGTFVNPRIERSRDGATFKLNATLAAGDIVEINTTRGHKSVKLNGTNVINQVAAGANWLQLEVGANELTLSDDNGSTLAYMQLKYRKAFV